jgi:hypothetical protein
MKTQIRLLFLFFSWIPHILFAQKLDLREEQIVVNRKEGKVILPYTLENGPLIYEFDTELYYSHDGGKTFQGPLKRVSGHIGKRVLAGDKRVIWHYEKEAPDFDGKNIQFKIKARYEPSVLNLRNEGAALYSLVVPGLGNPKVRYYKGWKWKYRWVVTTLLAYGTAGAAIWQYNTAQASYKDYLQATLPDQAISLYDQANQQLLLASGLAALSAAIWGGDVVRVFFRGLYNRQDKHHLKKLNEKMDIEAGIVPQATSQQQLMPSLRLTFRF